MIIGLAAMALAAAAPQATPTPTQAWAMAEANRPSMRTPPQFVEGPKAVLPNSEKAQGHHGEVVIEAILDIDGSMKEARVRQTSGAPALDDIALAAANATIFTPAKDANGAPLSVIISMPFDLVAYKSASGGIYAYKCGQFSRDMDWWRSVHPTQSFEDHELYKMELGMAISSMIQEGSRGSPADFKEGIQAFDKRWNAAIEMCRKKPDMLQKDAIYR